MTLYEGLYTIFFTIITVYFAIFHRSGDSTS